jgi:hypothetical protein
MKDRQAALQHFAAVGEVRLIRNGQSLFTRLAVISGATCKELPGAFPGRLEPKAYSIE